MKKPGIPKNQSFGSPAVFVVYELKIRCFPPLPHGRFGFIGTFSIKSYHGIGSMSRLPNGPKAG
jgi:hypothetical protein